MPEETKSEIPFPEAAEERIEIKAGSQLNRALEESFARVKSDILELKKALNQQAQQISEINTKIDGFINMYEFFEHMQKFDQKMEGYRQESC